MRLDRKLLLIAPTLVLVLVSAGIVYAAIQLHVLSSVSDSLKQRSDFIAAVERGEKRLDQRQALELLDYATQVESRRTAAISASHDLLVTLAAMALVSCAVLGYGIRSVPREHWPRLRSTERGPESPP